jgi:hypothetical protein
MRGVERWRRRTSQSCCRMSRGHLNVASSCLTRRGHKSRIYLKIRRSISLLIGHIGLFKAKYHSLARIFLLEFRPDTPGCIEKVGASLFCSGSEPRGKESSARELNPWSSKIYAQLASSDQSRQREMVNFHPV